MNTRLIISLLCAGVLAFACGPRSHSDSATVASLRPLELTNKVDVPSKRRNTAKPEAKIDSKFNVAVAPNEVRFAFNVTNVGKKHVELSFPNGRSYDFVVVDSLGREVWHWSTGRMFTQGVQNKQLGTGDVMHVAEALKRPLQPGRYTAIATLNSTNYPIEQRADFTLP
ncbi:MAG: BsuPI-related putative proteinase inhibitor [Gemmatimonadaceae bacterium]